MKTSVRRRISMGFFVSGVLLLLIVAADFRTTASYQQETNQLNTDRQIEDSASTLLTTMLNAETGQRGYIITGNLTYLAPYTAALQTVNGTYSQLGNLTERNSNLTAYYSQLQPLLSEKFHELNETIVTRQTQGFTAAQAIIDTNVGEATMDQIRALIADIVNAEDVAIGQLQTSTGQLASERLDLVYLFGLAATGVIAFTYFALRREFVKEDSLLRKESNSRRQTELLQDILIHDMRNYNQISQSNAEILKQSLGEDRVPLADAIIRAVKGSSELIDRTKTMARIISEEGKNLKDVELEGSVKRSLSLVAGAYPAKSLVLSSPLNSQSKVVADDLLDEVFANVLSNAVKYTSSMQVPIEINVEETVGTGDGTGSGAGKYVKVTITDHGKGVPEGMKDRIFTRYQNSGSGSGMGMSIVHALVVGRYAGRVRVTDRVPGDYTKGTSVEIWLPAA
jgi:CHASE3 domain sensor protein